MSLLITKLQKIHLLQKIFKNSNKTYHNINYVFNWTNDHVYPFTAIHFPHKYQGDQAVAILEN